MKDREANYDLEGCEFSREKKNERIMRHKRIIRKKIQRFESNGQKDED